MELFTELINNGSIEVMVGIVNVLLAGAMLVIFKNYICLKNIFNKFKLTYGKSFLKNFIVYWVKMLIYILILTTIVFIFLLYTKFFLLAIQGIFWGFQSFSNFIIMMCVLTFIISIIIAIKEKQKHLISEEKQN